MPKTKRPRRGSLQFYPRQRAKRFLHKINSKTLPQTHQGLQGFIAYKAGMATALVKDTTPKSLTLNKQIALPVTILETPAMKIFSVRFYKSGKVLKDVIVSNDKELKRKLKLPKKIPELKAPEDYDDIRLLVYSLPGQTSVKKTPDLIEIAVNAENKLEFIKPLIGKEISLHDFLKPETKLLDVRGLTKGKGTQGPVKRFGITLRFHKSEKGVRKVGSIAPWHPARVTFRTPMAGQLGLFSRIIYNLNVLSSGNIKEKNINPKQGFPNYGNIKTSYLIVKGSVQGPAKRQLVVTPSFRPSFRQSKKKLEFQELVR